MTKPVSIPFYPGYDQDQYRPSTPPCRKFPRANDEVDHLLVHQQVEHLRHGVQLGATAGVHEVDRHHLAVEEALADVGDLVDGEDAVARAASHRPGHFAPRTARPATIPRNTAAATARIAVLSGSDGH